MKILSLIICLAFLACTTTKGIDLKQEAPKAKTVALEMKQVPHMTCKTCCAKIPDCAKQSKCKCIEIPKVELPKVEKK
jgi:hypothetical protein